jgi:enoyl-CoA hydratase/carnithine racemase
MLRVVDLTDPPQVQDAPLPGVLVAAGPASGASEYWLDRASFTLSDERSEDRRVVTVESVPGALAALSERFNRWPNASTVCDDVLRSVDPNGSTPAGVVTESLAYSTLQAGPEFARWLAERGPAAAAVLDDPVLARRDGNTVRITFNRPERHNAFCSDGRAALLEALNVVLLDPSVEEFVLNGNGPSFCSGGDLAEFGTFTDPADAHLARTRYSPALVLDVITARLKTSCRAEIHGQVLGSGLEMAAFCGRVVCRSGSQLGLPELRLGLIPGAGGTVSVTRRIGRWRTAYLVLSGETIDAETALDWGLVDEVG